MAKASNNDYPSILITEQAAKPTAPATGKQRLYMKTDHKLYHEDSGGTETEVGAGVARSGSTTDNHLAVWNGSNADSLKDGGTAGGGGNVTFEATYASPPTPASGDLWYITDSLLHARYNGSAWQYYFGTQQVTKPIYSDFSTGWFNQSTSTLTDKGQLILYTPVGSTNYIRGVTKTAPSLNYSIEVIILPGLTVQNYLGCGFCWSDGTGYIMFGLSNISNASGGLVVQKWTNTSAFSADYTALNFAPWTGWGDRPIRLKVTEDASNRTCYYSLDGGNNYQQVHQVGRTDFITANKVGFMTYRDNPTYAVSMSLLHWKQS